MTLRSDDVVDALRAAGEPTRLRILSLLAREELAVTEICQILGQSQPRVSRHLKLLAEAGLIERFPDGAWVFYRLASGGERRAFLDHTLGLIAPQDRLTARDTEQLQSVRVVRSTSAATYFSQNAARWDQIRSLYVAEDAVESAILKAAGVGPFQRMVDLGSGTGRMLTLIGPRAKELLMEIDLNPSGVVIQEALGCYEVLLPAERGPELWEYLLEAGAPYGLACVGHDALDRLAAAHRFDS